MCIQHFHCGNILSASYGFPKARGGSCPSACVERFDTVRFGIFQLNDQTLKGSFSSVSRSIFATKCFFSRIFRNIKNYTSFANPYTALILKNYGKALEQKTQPNSDLKNSNDAVARQPNLSTLLATRLPQGDVEQRAV